MFQSETNWATYFLFPLMLSLVHLPAIALPNLVDWSLHSSPPPISIHLKVEKGAIKFEN